MSNGHLLPSSMCLHEVLVNFPLAFDQNQEYTINEKHEPDEAWLDDLHPEEVLVDEVGWFEAWDFHEELEHCKSYDEIKHDEHNVGVNISKWAI